MLYIRINSATAIKNKTARWLSRKMLSTQAQQNQNYSLDNYQ